MLHACAPRANSPPRDAAFPARISPIDTDADATADEDALIAIVDLAAVGVLNTWSVVVNPITNTVYVADMDNVVVVDGATHEIVTVLNFVDKGTGYIPSIAIDVALNQIYFAAYNEVLVIDGDTNQIADGIKVKGLGMGLAVNAVTHRVYLNNDGKNDELVVIDGLRKHVAGKHQSTYCQGIAVNPLTDRVYLFDRSGTASYGDIFVFQDAASHRRDVSSP